jgi:hypothetical protein
MVHKKAYVQFGDRIECIEFDTDTENEDLKGFFFLIFRNNIVWNIRLMFFFIEIFRSIAECHANDILKLYNSKGNIVNISNKIEQNTKNEPYRLEIIVKTIS